MRDFLQSDHPNCKSYFKSRYPDRLLAERKGWNSPVRRDRMRRATGENQLLRSGMAGPGPMLPYKRVQAEFFDSIVHLPECKSKVVGGPSPDPLVAFEGRRNFLALDFIQARQRGNCLQICSTRKLPPRFGSSIDARSSASISAPAAIITMRITVFFISAIFPGQSYSHSFFNTRAPN